MSWEALQPLEFHLFDHASNRLGLGLKNHEESLNMKLQTSLGKYGEEYIVSTTPIFENLIGKVIMGILNSPVKACHYVAVELLGRLIINPDNKAFLLSFFPHIHKCLIDLINLPIIDARAAAIGSLYNFDEVNMDYRLKIASER
ncbi:hypothetical protein KIW84_024271 [Lathyrus oleraceus]|uniref:Uncharacterized protein n=1 Tax=Pisum sativum TaxID=3888 RepID=A0A9D4YF63_PEA|nr:hypothetical protein KIW84_024271 [Pisum sativum]